jgi:hypothetical protein
MLESKIHRPNYIDPSSKSPPPNNLTGKGK